MVRLGSLCGLLFLLGGCLEQDLDVLSLSEAERLISGGSDKTWVASDGELQLQFNLVSTNRFVLSNLSSDSLSYGTWSVTSDIRERFTDSLLLNFDIDYSNTQLSDVMTVTQLTSEALDLRSETELLELTELQE